MSILLPSDLPSGPREIRTAFLIGAPRCGTTFLAKLLARHPNVCVSKPKETYFFVRDAAEIEPAKWTRSFSTRHFGHLESAHSLLVEGTPLVLRDPDAIERLLNFDPQTRFVVALRNPIEMVHSYHARLVFLLDEDERDFERAWSLQEMRARGERIPRRCRDPRSLQYREMACLGTQLEKLIELAGRERIHVVVQDDVAADRPAAYHAMLRFLALPDDGRTRFPRKNSNREFRHAWAQPWITNPPRPIAAWLESRQRAGRKRPEWVRSLRRRLKRWNTRRATRTPLPTAFRRTLQAEFAPEIEKLEKLLQRDLSSWRSANDEMTREGRSEEASLRRRNDRPPR